MRARATTPPTAMPTIAPVLSWADEEEAGEDEEDVPVPGSADAVVEPLCADPAALDGKAPGLVVAAGPDWMSVETSWALDVLEVGREEVLVPETGVG
jgi:hypothetical protein